MNLQRLSERDYYEVLEVPYDASPEDIQSAYDQAREMYGHDALVAGSILSEQERRSAFDRIAEAYQTLIAEESRRLYDERLGLERRGHARALDPPETGGASSTGTVPAPEPRCSPLQLGMTEEATGEFLRRAREALGLDLATISEETKIGCAMLEYIENERLDRLPAPIYLRNFTLQVAKCLGLDGEKVSRTYLARIRRLQTV